MGRLLDLIGRSSIKSQESGTVGGTRTHLTISGLTCFKGKRLVSSTSTAILFIQLIIPHDIAIGRHYNVRVLRQ